MDFGSFGGHPVGPPIFGRRRGYSYPAPPLGGPAPATQLAALLLCLFALPGLGLAVVGARVMSGSSDDMLAPVIGMVGVVVLVFGLLLATYALFCAARLWRRDPGAWTTAMVLAVTLLVVGPLVLFLFGAAGTAPLALGLVVLGSGASLVVLLLRPACRADFPAPLRTPLG